MTFVNGYLLLSSTLSPTLNLIVNQNHYIMAQHANQKKEKEELKENTGTSVTSPPVQINSPGVVENSYSKSRAFQPRTLIQLDEFRRDEITSLIANELGGLSTYQIVDLLLADKDDVEVSKVFTKVFTQSRLEGFKDLQLDPFKDR